MRGIAIAAAALFGAAWAQTCAPDDVAHADIPAAQTGDYSAIHSIAIVSTLGTDLRVAGANGDLHASFATRWNPDRLVVAALRKYLSGRFEIVEAAANADARLLVRPVDDPTPGPAGVGIHLGRGAALCANYEIELIDARRHTVLGKAFSRMQDHWGTPATFACYQEDTSLLAEFKTAPKAATLDALEPQLEILIPRSLVETLRSLKLGISLPPPGDHSIAPPESPADTDGIATVAVVSAIGDSFTFVSPRELLHAKEVVQTSVDLGLDAEVERIATPALARKFTVKAAAVDRAALARIVLQEHKHPAIAGLPPSADVDAYVLIVKAFREGTGASGPGLWSQGLLARSTCAFLNYAVVLVDARTGRVLKAALPAMRPESGSALPLVRVANALWPDDAKNPAAAAKSGAIMRTLIADSLPETLYQMGLTRD